MEFSSINNNFNIQTQAQQKAGLVQNNLANNQATQQQSLPQTPSAMQPFKILDPTIFDFQLAKMDNQTALKYLQNLMELPETIEKFAEQLNSKNINPKLSKILVENMLSVKVLSEFLNQNSTEAISKLMQTISTTLKSGISDVSQLKELLSILGTIQSSSSINTNTIKELLLLYIPLNAPVFDKNIDSKFDNEEEKEAVKNSKLSILFESINFSNLLFCVQESENNLFIDAFVSKNFPKSDFTKTIEILSKEASIVSILDFKDKQAMNTKCKTQNFKIISDGFISINSLILSHLIIKTIVSLDNHIDSN